MPDIILPVVHLNGSPRAYLVSTNEQALAAVTRAVAALQDAHPNARDYYPLGGAEAVRALDEHTARLEKLQSVKADLEAILMHLHDTGWKR